MTGAAIAAALLAVEAVILASPPVSTTDDSNAASETLQAGTDLEDRMTIDVAVQGDGPYRFLIDTGSQRTVVSTTLAETLGLASGPTVRIVSIAGLDRVATARVDSIDVGSRSFYDLTVPLLQHRHIGADGILGTDSLQHQRVVLDFTRNTIEIGDPHEMSGQRGYEIVVRARQRSGRLIMTNALIDGIRTDVVIDTGASSTIGNRALQRAMRERMTGSGMVTSVTGQTLPVDFQMAKKLTVDKLALTNVAIAFADAPAFAELGLGKRPAIFLGMRELRAFRRVAIDFTTRKILFDLPG
jgi:predicted aspartyl protease